MKIIRRRFPAHTIIAYKCEVCRTKYSTQKEAEKCEARKLEENKFIIGELVEKTAYQHSCRNRVYLAKGLVTAITGPVIPAIDHWNSYLWPEGDLPHVYQYEVEFVCPVCKQTKKTLCYSGELKSLKKKTR